MWGCGFHVCGVWGGDVRASCVWGRVWGYGVCMDVVSSGLVCAIVVCGAVACCAMLCLALVWGHVVSCALVCGTVLCGAAVY